MQVRLGLCAGRHEMPVNAYINDCYKEQVVAW